MALDDTIDTPEKEPWEDRFLDLMAETGNVSKAAKGARVGRKTVYRYREDQPNFAERWKEAERLGVAALEDECRRRAFKGSDTLMIFLLKRHAPETYRETVRNELTGADGAPLMLKWEDARSDPTETEAS